jgi:hypothetical protein
LDQAGNRRLRRPGRLPRLILFSQAAFREKGAAEVIDLPGGDTLKAVLASAATVLASVIAAAIPLLWQRNLRRRQQETEHRLKRVELVEKALNVAARAKAELGIIIGTKEIQSELSRILREIADPATLSREILDNYFNDKNIISFPPHFSIPETSARIVSNFRVLGIIVMYLGTAWSLGYWVMPLIRQVGLTTPLAFLFTLTSDDEILWCVGFLYLLIFFISLSFLANREARKALAKLRSMPTNGPALSSVMPPDAAESPRPSPGGASLP